MTIKEILGHADVKTTMKYSNPEKSLNEAVELVGIYDGSDSFTDILNNSLESV